MPRLSEPVFTAPIATEADAPPSVMMMEATRRSGAAVQPDDRVVARPASEVYLMAADILRVTNHGAKPYTFAWAGVRYPVRPGETGWVPFPALVDALGDPRSMEGQVVKYYDKQGNRGIVQDRYSEISRLFARYGVFNENIDDDTAPPPKTAPAEKGRPQSLRGRAPNVEVETLSGVSITFPVQHPKMVALPVANDGERQVGSDTRRMIDEMREEAANQRSEIARLERLISSRLGGAGVDDDATVGAQ